MLKRSKSAWTLALTLASVALIASAGAQAQGKSADKGKGADQAQIAWTAPGHVNARGNGHPDHRGNGYGHGSQEAHQDDGDNQTPGKSAGKGKGDDKAQTAWTAPGHVNAKGNGHANHKGNGYGHGPHEGQDDDGNNGNDPFLPEGCYAAAAVTNSINWILSGEDITTDGESVLATYQVLGGADKSSVYLTGFGTFQILSYDVSVYLGGSDIDDRETLDFEFDDFSVLSDGERPTTVEIVLDVGNGNYEVEIGAILCGDLASAGSPA